MASQSTPLFPTRVVSMKGRTKAPLKTVLTAIQNPSLMIHLNPLVVSCNQDSADKQLWHIRDTIRMLGYPMHIEYKARFDPTEHGVNVSSQAGMGTVLFNHWRARIIEDDQVEVSEEVEVQVSLLRGLIWLGELTRTRLSAFSCLLCFALFARVIRYF